MSEAAPAGIDLPRRSAVRFIVLLGVVDLFADMTYEGARSVTGPYLGVLGASAAIVGVVAGFGEFLGYALRLISGYLSDRTQSYWPITIIGYGINLLAVPLLALTGRWELAAHAIRARIEASNTVREKVLLWLSLAQLQNTRLRAPLDAMVSLERARALDPEGGPA